jgi:TonB-dependent receptor
LAPAEKVPIRLGYAEMLRRPSFAQLAPRCEFPLIEGQGVRVGDPNLQATTADQIDLAGEYYFRKGSVFSVGYFYKDLEDTIGTETLFDNFCNPIAVGDLSGPACADGAPGVRVDTINWVNLPGGTIKGFEVALQHNFNWLPRPWNAFGVIANYAYQDGERDASVRVPLFLRDDGVEDAEFPLNFRGLSEESYNFTLYFEKPRNRLSGRLRYTYRDGFLIEESSDVSNTLPLYRDDRGQLNASLSYRLTDDFSLTFSGVNLTKEQSTERAVFLTGPLVRQRDADRRYAIGISGPL